MWAAKASGLSQDFEHDESIRPELRLKRTNARRIDVPGIFDASLFRPDRRDIGAKRRENLIPAARFSGYDCDYADHCRSRSCRPATGRALRLASAD